MFPGFDDMMRQRVVPFKPWGEPVATVPPHSEHALCVPFTVVIATSGARRVATAVGLTTVVALCAVTYCAQLTSAKMHECA